jgi:hypothetical protein
MWSKLYSRRLQINIAPVKLKQKSFAYGSAVLHSLDFEELLLKTGTNINVPTVQMVRSVKSHINKGVAVLHVLRNRQIKYLWKTTNDG